ncbi:hypothetical protein D3C73_359190 [compost metagenome]
MRMAEDQLVVQTADNIVDREHSCFLFHLGMQHNLKQQVPKLFLHMTRIILINGLDNFIGLFNQVLADRLVGLLPVPLAAFGTTEDRYNLMQSLEAALPQHLIIVPRNID